MNDRAVDVLIVTYNSAATIGRCVSSIPPEADGLRVRVHVWDNASRNATTALLRTVARERRDVSLHLSGRNLGFPAACNRLLLESGSDVVCFLNPDVELRPGVLDALAGTVRRDATVGLATARLETPDGRPQPEAARAQPTLARVVLGGLGGGAARRFAGQRRSLTIDRDVDCAMGALLVARREVLERLHGLDESVFMYLEDVDLCRRVRDAGLRIRYLGSVCALHRSGSSRHGMESFLDRLGPVVWVTYFSRYGTRLEQALLRPALASMYAGRALRSLIAFHPGSALALLATAREVLRVPAVAPKGLPVRRPLALEEVGL